MASSIFLLTNFTYLSSSLSQSGSEESDDICLMAFGWASLLFPSHKYYDKLPCSSGYGLIDFLTNTFGNLLHKVSIFSFLSISWKLLRTKVIWDRGSLDWGFCFSSYFLLFWFRFSRTGGSSFETLELKGFALTNFLVFILTKNNNNWICKSFNFPEKYKFDSKQMNNNLNEIKQRHVLWQIINLFFLETV